MKKQQQRQQLVFANGYKIQTFIKMLLFVKGELL